MAAGSSWNSRQGRQEWAGQGEAWKRPGKHSLRDQKSGTSDTVKSIKSVSSGIKCLLDLLSLSLSEFSLIDLFKIFTCYS